MSDPSGQPRVLVVGSAPNSLGGALVEELMKGYWSFGEIITADLRSAACTVAGADGQHVVIDVRNSSRIKEVLSSICPDIVLCTVGVNPPCSIADEFLRVTMEDAFQVNALGVLTLLHHFLTSPGSQNWSGTPRKKFVAISSNSARIARRGSMAYCVSKAALSMGLRVAARETAALSDVVLWGYEPGLLAGTPMTDETIEHFGDPVVLPLHRMPGVGPRGLNVAELAAKIVADVANAGRAYHGLLIPFDANEQ